MSAYASNRVRMQSPRPKAHRLDGQNDGWNWKKTVAIALIIMVIAIPAIGMFAYPMFANTNVSASRNNEVAQRHSVPCLQYVQMTRASDERLERDVNFCSLFEAFNVKEEPQNKMTPLTEDLKEDPELSLEHRIITIPIEPTRLPSFFDTYIRGYTNVRINIEDISKYSYEGSEKILNRIKQYEGNLVLKPLGKGITDSFAIAGIDEDEKVIPLAVVKLFKSSFFFAGDAMMERLMHDVDVAFVELSGSDVGYLANEFSKNVRGKVPAALVEYKKTTNPKYLNAKGIDVDHLHRGLLSRMLLHDMDMNVENFIISEDGKRIIQIDHDHCLCFEPKLLELIYNNNVKIDRRAYPMEDKPYWTMYSGINDKCYRAISSANKKWLESIDIDEMFSSFLNIDAFNRNHLEVLKMRKEVLLKAIKYNLNLHQIHRYFGAELSRIFARDITEAAMLTRKSFSNISKVSHDEIYNRFHKLFSIVIEKRMKNLA